MESLRIMLSTLLDLVVPRHAADTLLERVSHAEFASLAHVTTLPDGVVYLFPYSNPLIEKAVWALKYRGTSRSAELFASVLGEILLEMLEDDALGRPRPFLVPVPLSRARGRERGYNQVEQVLQKLPETMAGTYEMRSDVLTKARDTQPQTMLSRDKRVENLRGVFRASEAVRGKRIVLIDDVTTTGATLAETKRALRDAGARDVVCIALAH